MWALRSAAFLVLSCVFLAPAPAPAQRDSFMCYGTKATKGYDRFWRTEDTRNVVTALDDRVPADNPQGLDPATTPAADGTFLVRGLREICTAADRGGLGIHNADALYAVYQVTAQRKRCADDPAVSCKRDTDCDPDGLVACIDAPTFSNRDPANQSVRIVDPYVDMRVDFGKPGLALFPTTFAPNLAGDWQGPPSHAEHYKCYMVRPTRASCVGGNNPGAVCRRDDACDGGLCERNPRFPRDTHPDGIFTTFADGLSEHFDPTHPQRPIELKRMRMFCQPTDVKLGPDPIATEPMLEPQAGLLCYLGKTARAACNGGDNDGLPCRRASDCPGAEPGEECRSEPRFDNKDPFVQSTYVEDSFFQHRLDVAKEGMFCTPACRAVEDFVLADDRLSHVAQLALGPQNAAPELAGLPRGVDVDGNGGTHAPSTESADGLDNQLMSLGGILNPTIQEFVDAGAFGVLLQPSALADGIIRIDGFPGLLADPAGCSVGTAPDPLDPGDPNDPCRYTVFAQSFRVDLDDTCRSRSGFELEVSANGTDTLPTATVAGGGPGNEIILSLPIGGNEVPVLVRNVMLEAEITHDGVSIEEMRGVIGGGVDHATLVDAVAQLPDRCFGGVNDGDECASSGDCPGGTCALVESFTAADLANLIDVNMPPDLDLDGDSVNESVSIGLLFRSTRAQGAGFE